jgi:transposase-like protein
MYSVDFRKRVVKRFKEGEKKSHLAKLFRIGRSTLERWWIMSPTTPPMRMRGFC